MLSVYAAVCAVRVRKMHHVMFRRIPAPLERFKGSAQVDHRRDNVDQLCVDSLVALKKKSIHLFSIYNDDDDMMVIWLTKLIEICS